MPHNKRVLVIDDDPHVLAYLKLQLEKFHFDCICVDNVAGALELMGQIRPDIVLLDLVFTTTSGNAFIENYRQRWSGPAAALPSVIVLSAHNDPEIVQHTLSLGAKGFITKPYEMKELVAMIHEYTL